MGVSDLPVAEVDYPTQFGSARLLAEHVVKHVLEDIGEQWEDLLEPRFLASVREFHQRGGSGRKLKKLANAYQERISGALRRACTQGHSHLHAAVPSKFGEPLSEDIIAWPQDIRCWIVATALVTNGQLTPYYLRTGFRFWPKLSPEAFQRKVGERIASSRRDVAWTLLAMHDAPPHEGQKDAT